MQQTLTDYITAPPLDDNSMQVDAQPSDYDDNLSPPSPPHTPTHRGAQPVSSFLSPIQRELNRAGTSLTQRTAGILNAEVRFLSTLSPNTKRDLVKYV